MIQIQYMKRIFLNFLLAIFPQVLYEGISHDQTIRTALTLSRQLYLISLVFPRRMKIMIDHPMI